MATGAVNSAAAAAVVLRTGEKLATTPAAAKSANHKTYYHRVPGAKTHLPDGLEIQFLGGVFMTDDPAIIAQLDSVANKQASGIYTDRSGVDGLKAAEQQLGKDAGDTAGTGTA